MPGISHLLDKSLLKCQTSSIMEKRSQANADLTRREEDILAILYRLGSATAAEIWQAMSDPPTYTAVRTHLTNLEGKGFVKFKRVSRRYVYEPAIVKHEKAKQAVDQLLKTFFENKVELVVANLINREESRLSEDQLDQLAEMIERARDKGL